MPFSLDDLKNKYKQLTQGQQNNEEFLKKFLIVNDGNNLVRILPSKDEELPFFAETKIHRVQSGNGTVKNVHCRKAKGEDCPLCDLYYSLWKTHEGLGFDSKTPSKFSQMARDIKPNARYYMNVYSRDLNEVKILSVGKKLFEKIVQTVIELQEEDMGDMLDLESGFDYKIVKNKIGGYPNYDQSVYRPKSTPLADSAQERAAIMESLHDIHGLVKLESYEEVKKTADMLLARLHGVEESDSSNEEPSDSQPNYLKQMEDSE